MFEFPPGLNLISWGYKAFTPKLKLLSVNFGAKALKSFRHISCGKGERGTNSSPPPYVHHWMFILDSNISLHLKYYRLPLQSENTGHQAQKTVFISILKVLKPQKLKK